MADVNVELDGHVQVIRINRPAVRNALNASVAGGIAAAIDVADASSQVRASVITGDADIFSSGTDLKALLQGESCMIEGRGLCGIGSAPPAKPLIAAVEGWALGAGLELLLYCDLIIASASARFGLPEARRGVVAGGGGAMLLQRKIAPAIALEMLLTGEPIDAERAASIGLINEVVPAGTALRRALGLAHRVAQNAPLAVRATKAVALQSAGWTREEMWQRQAAIITPVLESADAEEGGRAFLERRAPVWREL